MIVVRNVAAAVVVLVLACGWRGRSPGTAAEPVLAGSGDWLRINLVGGRLALKAAQLPPFERRFSSGGVKELFRFRYDNGQPALSYERTASDERLTLNLGGSGESVCIRREPREKSAIVAVEFKQSLKEKTSLTIGSGDRQQVFRAADLWRLLLAQPKQCQQHLFPLLAMLRPDLKLAEMVPSVEQHLLDGARENAAAARARWAALVEQLGDDCFAKREAADRALRTGGPAALRYLRQLDFAAARRRAAVPRPPHHRVPRRRPRRRFARGSRRLAGRRPGGLVVAVGPAGSPPLAASPPSNSPPCLGEPLKVDPAAEPDTQKQQREQLRTRIEKEQLGVGADGKKGDG